MKAISAVIATVMLLMISVTLVGVFYVFSTTMAGSTTASGGQQVTQLTSQLSSCMRIENINGNKVSLKNCGKGVIDNKSLVVTMDDTKLGSSINTISEDSSGTMNVSGLWQIAPGKHNLKISNGAAFAQALVEIIPNPDGLVGRWDFDEGSGNATHDVSGNGNMGTLMNGPVWVDGISGKALNLDGTNDFIQMTTHEIVAGITNTTTISAWLNVPNANPAQNIYAEGQSGGQVFIFTVQSNTIRLGVWRNGFWNTTVGTTVFQPNTWYHVAGKIDDTGTILYVNGAQDAYGNNFNSSTQNTSRIVNVTVGIGNNGGGISKFNGIIDEVRVWNTPLTPDETVVMKRII